MSAQPQIGPLLVLASRSPRRIELLRADGYAIQIAPADIDEESAPGDLTPAALAGYLAAQKAAAVAALFPGAVVLGADTVVAIGQTMFGKAPTPEAAREMLIAQAGQRQEVFTGVCVIAGQMRETVVERSVVEMRPMGLTELDHYVASDQWRGKAGAYGIQDQNPELDPFVRLLEGDMTNVVGLPMTRVRQMLASAGVFPRKAEA